MTSSAFQIGLGRLIAEEMKRDDAFGDVLNALLIQAAMLIIQQSRGDKAVVDKLLEASSDQLFQHASL